MKRGSTEQAVHELESTRTILNQALQASRQAQGKRITALHLVVGELSAHTPEDMQKHWGDLSRGTEAAGAVLYYRRVQAEAQCMSCFTKYHPRRGEIVCPACGGVGAKIIRGEEFYIETVDFE